MIDWLLAPIDPERLHAVGFHVSWHARLMVFAWGFLFPGGILAARFFKVMPGQDWPRHLDNRIWWNTHRSSQYLGGALMLVALGLILLAPGRSWDGSTHAILGWATAAFGAFQFLSGWLRGSKGGPTDPRPDGSLQGDHYDMTAHRRAFEWLHKSLGYLALALACAAIVTGLWHANAPHWMWLSILVWWAVLLAVFWVLQSRGRAIDTYQAIWGPDPRHPGNRMKPIGFGIRRPAPRDGATGAGMAD